MYIILYNFISINNRLSDLSFYFSIYKLTSPYNIQLDIVDSNLHFIEKSVSLFEQTKIAGVKDFKSLSAIEDFMEETVKCVEKKEDFVEYLHKKIPCRLKIDVKKWQHYRDIRNTITDMCPGEKSISALASASADEFIFNEILPDGKLLIPDRCPDDDGNRDDDDDDARLKKDIVSEQMELSWSKFCKVYNANLSSTEKKAVFKDLSWSKKRKRKLVRNVYGKFVKQNNTSLDMESPSKGDCYAKETEIMSADISEIENMLPEISDILNSSINASVFDNFIKIEDGYDMDDRHKSEKSCKAFGSIDASLFISDKKSNSDDILKLFRPFKDYWMYHCNFSRVKPKNFELLEKMLPKSFRWLLSEAASVVEMSTEDLYEEVCLVEAYYAYVLEQSKIYSSYATSETEHCNNRAYISAILKKW